MSLGYKFRDLRYYPVTGNLYRVKKVEYKLLNKSYTKKYARIFSNGKFYNIHVLCWAAYHGSFPSTFIDHIDRVKSNLRISNLRLASGNQNQWNRSANVGCKHKNVYYQKESDSWYVQVRHGKTKISKYGIKDVKQAVAYANELRIQLHGDFAFIDKED